MCYQSGLLIERTTNAYHALKPLFSILSKIERGKRPATREMALKMSTFFEIDTQTLLNEYLSDKIVNLIYEENDCNEILKLAEEKVEYLKKTDR